MNERLELLRKRLRGVEAAKANWRAFWIGSPTAWLALLISIATALLNVVYYKDELAVVFDSISGTDLSAEATLMSPIQVMFVNSGSRSVGISHAELQAYLAGRDDERLDDCTNPELFGSVDVVLEPMILKAGEITSIKLSPGQAGGAYRITKPADKAGRRSFFCLHVNYVTTSSVLVESNKILIPVVWSVLRTDKSFFTVGEIKRQYLVRRSTFRSY